MCSTHPCYCYFLLQRERIQRQGQESIFLRILFSWCQLKFKKGGGAGEGRVKHNDDLQPGGKG